jgi:hypothetical protein
MSGPRLLQRRRPQQAADVIGAERRRGPLHRFPPVGRASPCDLGHNGEAIGRLNAI